MSAAAAAAAPTADAGNAKPAKKGKKKLLIMIGIAVLLLGLAGGGTMFYLKSKAAQAAALAEEEEGGAGDHKAAHVDPKHPPTCLPLDPFVVNLADKDADRYAQIGITLEIESPAFADQMKTYMPAVRNTILLILATKSSRDLLDRAGKEALAAEILREAVRPLGIEPEAPGTSAEKSPKADDEEAGAKPKHKPMKKPPAEPNPLRAVHFSNFIIQ